MTLGAGRLALYLVGAGLAIGGTGYGVLYYARDEVGSATSAFGGDNGGSQTQGAQSSPDSPKELESRCHGDDLNACIDLGGMYEKGEGVPIDLAKAKALYSEACEGGNQEGCVLVQHLTPASSASPAHPSTKPRPATPKKRPD